MKSGQHEFRTEPKAFDKMFKLAETRQPALCLYKLGKGLPLCFIINYLLTNVTE